MAENERLEWELADGPVVGREIPITGEPRQVDARGWPEREQASDEDAEPEIREVKVADPALSDAANERLTEEVREVVGTSQVKVPSDRAKPSRGEHTRSAGRLAYLGTHRLLLAVTFAALLTIGAIVSLATGTWWLLPVAAGVHALGTLTIVTLAISLTTVTEHASPTTAAMLEEEGIRNPDRRFSELVEEFGGADQSGPAEVVSPGANQRTVNANAAPGTAAAEQSSAMTPTADASEPAGQGGAPDVMIWSTAVALLALSVFIPAAGGGGRLWLLTAVMVPLLAGWMMIQRLLSTPSVAGHAGRRASLIMIAACTVLAVIAFCLVVALGLQR